MSTGSTHTQGRHDDVPRSAPAVKSRNTYEDIDPLLARLAAMDASDPRRKGLREDVIGQCMPLAEHIARKYAGRGEAYEDLLQIACLGLLAAIDRFDPAYGATFEF
ncbi:sigma factor [Nocardia sp. NPDC020380]|uniref:sigma factor n=1 Tax=Nocardia sp. NPDC020380 TaxID=3364309 RepID=UPI003794DC50